MVKDKMAEHDPSLDFVCRVCGASQGKVRLDEGDLLSESHRGRRMWPKITVGPRASSPRQTACLFAGMIFMAGNDADRDVFDDLKD
jgi:hypothetical protein